MNITFRYLQLLNAVVVAGSISKARRLTGLSQPTISQQLAKFEEELGTQLVYRRRGQSIELTPAGEHWYRASVELLNRREQFESIHQQIFSKEQIVLRFGATPSLRGRFTSAAGKIAVEIGRFTRFEQVFALSSAEIVDMIDAHQINCAVVSATSVADHHSALSIRPLFTDRLLWVVPASVPEEVVAGVLADPRKLDERPAALNSFVEITAPVPWDASTKNWYRERLPGAVPFFVCQTHQTAVDFVAGGLCTCHCPMSLLPNLSDAVLSKLRFYDLDNLNRKAVFVMPRHLASLAPFTAFRDSLHDYVVKTFSSEEMLSLVLPMPTFEDRPSAAAS